MKRKRKRKKKHKNCTMIFGYSTIADDAAVVAISHGDEGGCRSSRGGGRR